jgi:hypothetical protein
VTKICCKCHAFMDWEGVYNICQCSNLIHISVYFCNHDQWPKLKNSDVISIILNCGIVLPPFLYKSQLRILAQTLTSNLANKTWVVCHQKHSWFHIWNMFPTIWFWLHITHILLIKLLVKVCLETRSGHTRVPETWTSWNMLILVALPVRKNICPKCHAFETQSHNHFGCCV